MPIDPVTAAWLGAQAGKTVAQVFEKNPHTGLFPEKPGETDHLPMARPGDHDLYMQYYFATTPEHQPPPNFVVPDFNEEELAQIMSKDMASDPAYAEEMNALVKKAQARAPAPAQESRPYHNPERGGNYSLENGEPKYKYQADSNPQRGGNYSLEKGEPKYHYKKGGTVVSENGKLAAPWQQNNSPVMLVVHMTAGELEGLDNLQGGPSLDEETGLREYSKLATIIEEPAIRDLFKQVSADFADDGKLSPQMQELYNQAKDASLAYEDAPVENTEPTKDIEDLGEGDDRHMAIIPENLALFFVELNHEVNINPETGLLQLNKEHEVARVVGTVGGFMMGGPMGAAAGNMAARWATGQKPGRDMLMAGAKNAAYGYGAQALGQMAGVGQAGGAFGTGWGAPGSVAANMASKGLGPQNYGAYGSFFGKPAATAAATVAPRAATAAGVAGAAAPAAGAAPAAAATSGWDKFLSAAPWIAMGLSAHGQKQDHSDQTKMWEENKKERERTKEESGFNIKPRHVEGHKWKKNPDFKEGPGNTFSGPMYIKDRYFEPEYAKGGAVNGAPKGQQSGSALQSFHEGTLIKGPGKGQEDKIRTTVPEGSYIIDATTVAHFGDGSSEAGAKVLKEYESLIKRNAKLKKPLPSHPGRQVDVFLSNDEYKFDPHTVSLLGGGSNQKGSAILKTMVKNLRQAKNSNGNRLPPKAKAPMHYMMKGK